MLTVLRKGVNAPLTFTLVREVINVKSVASKTIEPGLRVHPGPQVPGTTPAPTSPRR